jgi:hypothetical protein
VAVSNLFSWGGREASVATSTPSDSATEVAVSKVLPRLFKELAVHEAPVIMDLGPVVGSNISLFGEALGCKIFVEDLFTVVEAQARAGARELAGGALCARLTREPGSIDGILCWDLFDYLDKASAKLVANKLVTLLRPGGVLHGFFCSLSADVSHYSRFVMADHDRYRLQPRPATPTKRQFYVVRDIDKLFEGLAVTESVLLKSRSRETLFRKPV